jgi:serine/threonine protein kinase
MSESKLDLDQLDHQRVSYEIARVQELLPNGRTAANRNLAGEKTNNWFSAFSSFGSETGKTGYDSFQWEEVMESTLGFRIDRSRKIGSGKFGECYPVQGNNEVGQMMVKIFKKKEFASLFKILDLGRHFAILAQLNHPNIARLVGVFESIKTEKMYVFTQLAPYGSLCQLVKERGQVSESLAKRWAKETATGLSYLHFLGIAFRRLTPKAVLLDSPEGTAKLEVPYCFAEIGDPMKGAANEGKTRTSPQLLSPYNAPETIFGSSFLPLPADVWSYGCVIYFMLVMKPPLDHYKDRKLVKEQLDKKVWQFAGKVDNGPKLPKGSKPFFSAILHGTIEKRPSMSEVLSLPWIN